MTPRDVFDLINGRQYREEIPEGLAQKMKAAGIVAVFGASDDLIEFEGAISDEIGAGDTVFITPYGLFNSKCQDEDCPYALRERDKTAVPLTALFSNGGFTFRYETEIPHIKFTVMEDDETYCEGIIFSLADVSVPVKVGVDQSLNPSEGSASGNGD